jgi:hypothetical protein
MNSERRSCSARSKLLERILIPLWGASGGPAVHPASAVRHRGRLAPDAGSCPRSAPSAQVRGRFALHGVDSPFSLDPHPPGSGPSRPLPDPACTWTCPTVTFCWPFPRCLLSASSNVARCGRAYLPGSDFPADLRKSQAVSGLSLIAMTFTGSPAVVWYRSSYFVPRGSPNGEAAPVREDRPNGQENIGDLRRARDLSLFAGENFAKRKQLEAAPINCVPASVPVDQLGALTVIPLPGGRAEGW